MKRTFLIKSINLSIDSYIAVALYDCHDCRRIASPSTVFF